MLYQLYGAAVSEAAGSKATIEEAEVISHYQSQKQNSVSLPASFSFCFSTSPLAAPIWNLTLKEF